MTNEQMREAEEMSENLEMLSSDRLCFLVVNNPDLKALPEMGPSSILITELMRRVWDRLPEANLESDGWILENEKISYEEVPILDEMMQSG